MTSIPPTNPTTQEVIDFIHKRFQKDCHWTDGNCFYFATILHTRFPTSQIIYDPIDGHFMIQFRDELGNCRYFDWTGQTEPVDTDNVDLWDEMSSYDETLYKRIWRDCIQ